MKSWLIFLIPLLAIILGSVLIQFHWTRRAMAAFAKRHGVSYKNPGWNLFDIGELSGKIDAADFFMGEISTNYGFGPVTEQDNPDEKFTCMRLDVSGMPERMVIHRRGNGKIGDITDFLSHKTGIPMVKTGDAAFDSRFNVVGYPEEVLPWLTAQRRETMTAFLSRENCVATRGGLQCDMSRTHISIDDLEAALLHLTATRRALRKAQ